MPIRSLVIVTAVTVISGTAHGKYDERKIGHPIHPRCSDSGIGHTNTKKCTYGEGAREVRRAIDWLAPYVRAYQRALYSKLIYRKATARKIDPLLVVALIHKESGFSRTCVSKKNYGLMQVRVSATTNADLLGREYLLRVPWVNLHRGLRLLSFWKRYHEKHCAFATHFWTSHYQYGYHVSDSRSGKRVRKLYEELVERFRTKPATS